jgi:branched-chain amino acid transport system permease protein
MAVIGGIGTILGPILGAIAYVILQEYLIASYPELYLGLYGLLLVLVILFEPLGFSGLLLRLGQLVGYRPTADVAAGAVPSSHIVASEAMAQTDAAPISSSTLQSPEEG